MRNQILCKLVLPAVAVAFSLSGAFAGELPTAKDAAKQLFKSGKKSTEVRILRDDLVPGVYKQALESAASIQKYYEAMAVSPTEGMLANSASHAINHHTAAAAHAAAIAGCNSKKKTASEDCVVVAEFLPKGYDGPRDFSLSAIASKEFAKKYRRSAKPKAFAISPSSGFWGRAVKAGSLAEARAAALAECQAEAASASATDCVLVSEN